MVLAYAPWRSSPLSLPGRNSRPDFRRPSTVAQRHSGGDH